MKSEPSPLILIRMRASSGLAFLPMLLRLSRNWHTCSWKIGHHVCTSERHQSEFEMIASFSSLCVYCNHDIVSFPYINTSSEDTYLN